MTDTKLYDTLKERGLLYQCTDEEGLKKALTSGAPLALYEGTDPTMDSLHLGHCIPYCILRRFQKAGHKVVLLMGGATACIGDPSGKSEMRSIMNKETIAHNIEKIKNSLKIFLDFDGENPAIIVNNADWFTGYDYTDFMREIGVHFNVNKMLANELYAKRIQEGGLTFFEMGYMLMQAYDFIRLNRDYGVTLQYGGADQWGNIVAGVELQRKLNFANNTNINLIGATNPLLVTPEGVKMGKTERGAIWLDRDKITAYDFYQGIYQTPDACVEMMFALFTDIPMQEVRDMIKRDIVAAKKILSYEITKFVRGQADAEEAQRMSENLFTHGGDDAPTFVCATSEYPLNIVDVLVKVGFASSKGEARRLIEGGGVSVDGEKVSALDYQISGDALIKKGKKNFIKVVKE